MNEQWLKDIRHRVSQHKEPAPVFSAGEWDAIAASIPPKKAVLFPAWARVAVAAAVLLGVIGLGLRLQRPIAPEKIASRPIPVELVTEQSLERLPVQTARHEKVKADAAPAQEDGPMVNDPQPPNEVLESVNETPTPQKDTPKPVTEWEDPWPEEWPRADQPRRASRLTVQAFVSGAGGSQATLSPRMLSASVIGAETNKLSTNSGVLETVGDTKIDVNHRIPIRVGLTLGYGLGGGWSLESGVAVSYHFSEFKTGDGFYTSTTNQELLFIGLPLNLNYRFTRWNRLGLYASAGGLMEKLVSGSSFTTGSDTRERVGMKALQLSVNAGLGLDYRLTRGLSLYAEPGLRYSFNNGSGLTTIYTDRPLDFNLTVGLRVHFSEK